MNNTSSIENITILMVSVELISGMVIDWQLTVVVCCCIGFALKGFPYIDDDQNALLVD